jgi:type I restriction enzyme R subunit
MSASRRGVAVREFQTDSGPVDYALFIDRRLRGVIEAKAEGVTLSAFSEQAERYIAGAPAYLLREKGQVRFEYVASAREILFRDHAKATIRFEGVLGQYRRARGR